MVALSGFFHRLQIRTTLNFKMIPCESTAEMVCLNGSAVLLYMGFHPQIQNSNYKQNVCFRVKVVRTTYKTDGTV